MTLLGKNVQTLQRLPVSSSRHSFTLRDKKKCMDFFLRQTTPSNNSVYPLSDKTRVTVRSVSNQRLSRSKSQQDNFGSANSHVIVVPASHQSSHSQRQHSKQQTLDSQTVQLDLDQSQTNAYDEQEQMSNRIQIREQLSDEMCRRIQPLLFMEQPMYRSMNNPWYSQPSLYGRKLPCHSFPCPVPCYPPQISLKMSQSPSITNHMSISQRYQQLSQQQESGRIKTSETSSYNVDETKARSVSLQGAVRPKQMPSQQIPMSETMNTGKCLITTLVNAELMMTMVIFL